MDHFVAAASAGDDGNGCALHSQQLSEEHDARVVGAAVNWWGGEGKLQRVAEFADDGVLPTAWMNPDGKGAASCRFVDRDHSFMARLAYVQKGLPVCRRKRGATLASGAEG